MSTIAHLLMSRVKTFFAKLAPIVFQTVIAEQERRFNALIAEQERRFDELAIQVRNVTMSLQRQAIFIERLKDFRQKVPTADILDLYELEQLYSTLRGIVRDGAGLLNSVDGNESAQDLMAEVAVLQDNKSLLKPVFQSLAGKRVLFAGQAYYNAWYLSRELRKHGWTADVLNWDLNPSSQIYYHGEDYRFTGSAEDEREQNLRFFVRCIYAYDVFHFSNAHGISFGHHVQNLFSESYCHNSEIFLLKALGKKIVYSNNGCLDGVSQTAFSRWGPESVCSICYWRDKPDTCSDERNLTWGRVRNSVADFQCLLGGNRVDFNDDSSVHEVPQFYCLDPDFWHPEITIPERFRLPPKPKGTIWLYHGVGNKVERTRDDGVNIKCSHIYLPLIQKLNEEGLLIELLAPTDIPNKEVRFLQAQADIFLDMLTYGWFGATAREGMMLGKPVICFIRPEWLESLKQEIPDYAAELPIVSATPSTVEAVLRDLIANPDKRRKIGERSREFAVKWHSAEAGARRFDEIYSKLLKGDPLSHIPVLPKSAHE